MSDTAEYYLNKYRATIMNAIRKSKRDCVEYGVVKPENGRIITVAGNRGQVIFPGNAVRNAPFLFHTHPFYECEKDVGEREFQLYYANNFGVKFSSQDINLFKIRNIDTGILAGYLSSTKVILRAYESLNNIQQSNFTNLTDELLFNLRRYIDGVNREEYINPLKEATKEVKEFNDIYFPVIEYINI